MMNKELIELQKGCEATCVIIQNENICELETKMLISSNCKQDELVKRFKEKISETEEEVDYIVIEKIDEVDIEKQDKFYHLVKDRESSGYVLPKDVVIVFTVKDKEGLKIYHRKFIIFL